MPVKLTVALPDLPSTVPVKTPAPKKEPFPEDRRITVSCPAKVPAKSPCVTIVSVCVTIRFPSTILTPVLVAEVVNAPVTVVGVAALTVESKSVGMRSESAIQMIFT